MVCGNAARRVRRRVSRDWEGEMYVWYKQRLIFEGRNNVGLKSGENEGTDFVRLTPNAL